jgi:hypothetical protein
MVTVKDNDLIVITIERGGIDYLVNVQKALFNLLEVADIEMLADGALFFISNFISEIIPDYYTMLCGFKEAEKMREQSFLKETELKAHINPKVCEPTEN